jgi:hypothetical protein
MATINESVANAVRGYELDYDGVEPPVALTCCELDGMGCRCALDAELAELVCPLCGSEPCRCDECPCGCGCCGQCWECNVGGCEACHFGACPNHEGGLL